MRGFEAEDDHQVSNQKNGENSVQPQPAENQAHTEVIA
jgi:hypothetical protein